MNPILYVFLFFSSVMYAQMGAVSGRILDAESNQALPYAEISITVTQGEKPTTNGVISDEKGKFTLKNLPFGSYTLKISFVGYETISRTLEINTEKIDLGDFHLKMVAQQIEGVVVQGKKAAFSYQVDRKTINAAAFPDAQTAIDLLTNIPSLQVTEEGKVIYREGGTFTVYINGIIAHDGQERLRTLNASQIEKIDIITNPSAKYSASGTAGIIRVVLKKNRLQGYAIDLSTQLTTRGTHNFSFSVDKKGKRGGWHASGYYQNNVWLDYTTENTYIVQNPSGQRFQTLQNSEFDGIYKASRLEFGFNYDLSDRDFIDFSINYEPIRRKEDRFSKYRTTENLFDANNNLISTENLLFDNQYHFTYQPLSAVLEYNHFFNKDKTHFLKIMSDYTIFVGGATQYNKNQLISNTENFTFGNKSFEKDEVWTATNIDYELPLTEKSSLEAGLSFETDHIPEVTAESGYFSGDEITQTSPDVAKNQLIDYMQNIYAGYLTFKSSFGKFEYKLGLRAEQTVRDISYSFDDSAGVRHTDLYQNTFTDWFPSAHFLYSFTKDSQLALNYSRRINRPSYMTLIPMFVWDDRYGFSTGNSRLLPSYTNSYELMYKNSWGKDFVSLEVFARNETDIMNNFSRILRDNILLTTRENVGEAWAIGSELMGGVDIFKWWNVNSSFSAFLYDQDLSADGKAYHYKQWRYTAKLNQTFKLPFDISLRLNASYQSPTTGLQIEQEGIFLAHASLTKSWKNGKWQASLYGNNILDTYRYTAKNTGENFNSITHIVYKPFVGFTLKYRFDNQR
ncbi:MAG: outer membrane beta-barrel family protein [Capnocytophaga sp.]|nr:outer membrane beta-barrel family protein [Capnocytophaga sp.]